MNINQFVRGDLITRVESNSAGWRGYLGSKLIFLGIMNNQIHFKDISEDRFIPIVSKEPEMLSLDMDMWSEGWAKWQDPSILLEGLDLNLYLSKEELNRRIIAAVAAEDYTLAD